MTGKMVIEKMIRKSIPHFNHVIIDMQEHGTLATMKMEDLIWSIETCELRTLERNGVHYVILCVARVKWPLNVLMMTT